MLNPNDRAKYGLEKVKTKPLSLIDKADQVVNILEIYRAMGFYAPDYFSYKVDCPFFNEHADGGKDKNTRAFPPTHIYCFGSHGVIKPTFLYSRWKGIEMKRAAIILLEERGVLKNKGYKEKWLEITEFVESKQVKSGSASYAIDALQMRFKDSELYQEFEYSEPVRYAWSVVLAALDRLLSENADVEKLNRWLENSYQYIHTSLKGALYEQ